jgi:predicted N-acetyltransferase YhbS
MKTKLRPLAAGDLDAVVAIDASISGRTRRGYFERRLAAALRAPKLHAQYAAEDQGALAGYVLGRVLEGEFGRIEPAMRLEVVGVKPEARGRGIGLALERSIEDDSRRRGLKEMRTGASWRDRCGRLPDGEQPCRRLPHRRREAGDERRGAGRGRGKRPAGRP